VKRRSAATLASFAAAGLLASACFSHDYRTRPRVAVVAGDPIVQMTRPGKLPTLDEPHYVAVDRHSDPPFPDEEVVGVRLSGTPRMYPIGLLDTYEVLNDEDGGVPYVVARCPLTDLSAVFDRRVAGLTLTFENSGALWRDMLVMRDRETGTYWTPATGEALSGPLAGAKLRGLPAPRTTARAWEKQFPHSTCPETGDLTAVSLRLRLYAISGWQGVSGEKTDDARYPPKETVYYVDDGNAAAVFDAGQARQRGRFVMRLAGEPITIEWDAALETPRAFRQNAGGREELPVVPIYWFALERHDGAGLSLSYADGS
jgi:hypothetical protein